MSRVNGHTADEVIAAVRRNHGLLASVARDLGVTRQTVYNYVTRYPTIAQAVHDERETWIDVAESRLLTAINLGSVPAIMFFLKTVGKSRGYVERQEVSGSDNGPINVVLKVVYDDKPVA